MVIHRTWSKSEIERMAKEAELADEFGRPLPAYPRRLAKFAALLAVDCAKVCIDMPYSVPKENSGGYAYIHTNNPADCGRAILAKYPMPALSGWEAK